MTQLTLDDGLTLKTQGQDAIEATDAGFVDTMRRAAIAISERNGLVSTDDLRLWAVSNGFYPKHHNSWGAIFRGPQWREVGRKKSVIPGNHHREIRIWRYER